MEEFDDDDFSDLYADVEVQASSAISALHRSTELPHRIAANAPAAEEKGGGGGGGDSRNLPVENGDRCESRSRSWSEGECESESEDGLASNGDDGAERKVGENYERKRCEEICGKEKSVNRGDNSSPSQRKYNSSNSKTKRVHESAQQGGRMCGKGDADDRNLDFSRNSDDNQPHYRQKHGGPKIASERHTEEASHPVPLDLDKRGSVQISDSVEDSPSEVSECDSDGISETSDDTNRRKARCMSNKVSSAREPEPFKSSRSQRDRSYSSSPSRAAPGSRYSEKIPKRLKYSSSSFRSESREPIAQKNRSPDYSESRGVRRGTGDGGHHERWRDSTQERSNHLKKSHHIPHFKNRPDEDSYATNAKHLYNRHVNHGKQRAVVDLKYNERDIPYCSHSERMLAYSGRGLPDHHLGPAFLKDQYWDNPSSRYKAGPPDVHYISERQNFLDRRVNQLEYNRFHNQRRHHFQDGNEGFRNLQYSSAVDQRGIQLMYKGEGEHLRRRTRQDCLSPLHDYDDRFVEGKYRTHPNSGEDRDYLDCRYDRDVPHDRREMESSSRGNRRRHIPLNISENPCYIKDEVNDRRRIKPQPFPFSSFEEPYASIRGEFVGASGPKAGVAQRNMRCSWKEMRIECDQYGTEVAPFGPRESLRYRSPENFHVKRGDYQPSSNINYARESIKDNRNQDRFVGRRRNQHSEVFLPNEDVYKSRQQDNIVFGSKERSHNFKGILKNDDRPASCRITELSEKQMGRRNSNLVGEEDNSNHFDASHQDSVDRLVVVGRKSTLQSSIRTTTEAGEATYYGRCDLSGNNEPDISEDTGESKPAKTIPTNERVVDAQQSKLSKNHQNESLDIEEGQIITEEIRNEGASGHPETTSNDNGVVEKLGDEKLQEILMKMERRRERFKEPITSSRDGEKTSSPLPDLNVETAEARLGRPARKRRWLGN